LYAVRKEPNSEADANSIEAWERCWCINALLHGKVSSLRLTDDEDTEHCQGFKEAQVAPYTEHRVISHIPFEGMV
jgi:hypothetical protein